MAVVAAAEESRAGVVDAAGGEILDHCWACPGLGTAGRRAEVCSIMNLGVKKSQIKSLQALKLEHLRTSHAQRLEQNKNKCYVG